MALVVKVAIIGAGMAGAAAANRLHHAGITDIVVLEAMDRIGGRTHTFWLNEPEHEFQREKVEMGANWIHHIINNPIYELACQHCGMSADVVGSLTRRPNLRSSVNMAPSARVLDKRTVREVNRKISQALNKAYSFYRKDPTLDGTNDTNLRSFVEQELDDYFKQFVGDELAVRRSIFENRILFENSTNGCHDLNEVSTLQSGSYREFEGPDIIIPGGFENIVKGMLRDIPKKQVLLQHQAKIISIRIDPCCTQSSKDISNVVPREFPKSDQIIYLHEQTNDISSANIQNQPKSITPCAIVCDNGQLIYADYVIFTGSLNVLKAQASSLFIPALPAAKLQAIDSLGMGVVNKIFMQFPDLDFLSEGDFYKIFHDRQNLEHMAMEQRWLKKIPMFTVEPTAASNILTFWLSGEEAIFMESLSEDKVKDDVMSFLQDFLQREIPEPTWVTRTQWHSNPYTRGSYSFMAVGSTTGDIRELAKPIADPQTGKPVLLFAGEATHEEFYSTTHGAVMTGRREADRILEQEGLSTTITPRKETETAETKT